MRKTKDTDYFECFAVSAQYAKEAANFLYSCLENFDAEKLGRQVEEMHVLENAADMARHTMTRKLSHEFITPIEREDIVALSHGLDDVVDAIDDILRRIYMYNVREIRPETLKMARLIVDCCSALEIVVKEFADFKKSKTINEKIIAVNTLESTGDGLHYEITRQLFVERADTRTTVIWMTIFDGLENCLDACENVTDIVESVVMKNS